MTDSQRNRRARVIVVDDHPMLRDGTAAFLDQAPDIEVIGVASHGHEALAMIDRSPPEVLILDIHLPDVSGVEVARIVREKYPLVGIVVLTGYDDVGQAQALLDLGVQGYLQKTAAGSDIVAAVRAAVAGPNGTMPTILSAGTSEAGQEFLTIREQEVVRLLDKGLRNSEIAAALAVSPKTVEYHMTRLLAKLHARSRTEAIVKVRQSGLVNPGHLL
jgi:DNA-binding NarL/FixJ family response regulator